MTFGVSAGPEGGNALPGTKCPTCSAGGDYKPTPDEGGTIRPLPEAPAKGTGTTQDRA